MKTATENTSNTEIFMQHKFYFYEKRRNKWLQIGVIFAEYTFLWTIFVPFSKLRMSKELNAKKLGSQVHNGRQNSSFCVSRNKSFYTHMIRISCNDTTMKIIINNRRTTVRCVHTQHASERKKNVCIALRIINSESFAIGNSKPTSSKSIITMVKYRRIFFFIHATQTECHSELENL